MHAIGWSRGNNKKRCSHANHKETATMHLKSIGLVAAGVVALGTLIPAAFADDQKLLNVSYDPTRELYAEINTTFAEEWQKKTGEELTINNTHGGSGKQARSVIDGLDADVVTLALAYDIDAIAAQSKKLPVDWQKALPHNSSAYTSTIVFLVREGNPKGIKDWGDLIKPGIEVITPNPKTSGGARWNYLAAWAWARRKHGGDDEQAKRFVAELFKHVPVLDTGARGSTTTFVQRGIGDVLLAWENEAFLALKELGEKKLQIVVPSLSILAEAPVAVVTENAKKKRNSEVAQAYLEFLYTDRGQQIVARHFYRPANRKAVDAQTLARFPQLELVTIDNDFGGWAKAQKQHFADGGFFDQIYEKR
jgi:sulfate/thiosulfate-binding protein